jgi:TonB family protein
VAARPVRVRIVVPHPEEVGGGMASLALHLAALVAIVIFASDGAARTGKLGPTMTVRLAAGVKAPPGGGARGVEKPAEKFVPVRPPAPIDEKLAPTNRLRATDPPKVAPPPKGLTAQPEKMRPLEPQAPQKDQPGTPGTAGTPGATGPDGPIAGGVAGLGSDEPFTYDYYTNLVVTRLQEAWQNRPILPAGSDTVRVVVAFVIEDDGRVTGVEVETPSGYTPLDQSAYRAVLSLGQLPPLPRAYEKDRLTARFVFELLPPDM